MATITLKDISEHLRVALRERAARNRRSLNQELLYCLERLVEFVPENQLEAQDRRNASMQGLMKVWENREDDVYNELLKK